MFKTAATKIAHNTTIPALAGHSDLRPLQDLINAEKAVLTSLQKLRTDLTKSNDALRIWGQGEGEDLSDIFTASSTILMHFATALSTYSSLHNTIRDSMKSVRTREEALDDLRRRRRRVGGAADSAEKKLHKMSPEHKNLAIQTDVLNKLRDEMRALDAEIIREEAELGDYKRKCARDWMGFKFGGLVECCEKGVIVGEFGRQIIQSIPEDVTEPGLPRVFYSGQSRVSDLVAEAQRVVSQVTFSGNPTGLPASVTQPRVTRDVLTQSLFLPTPSLGSELTLGVAAYNLPPVPPPQNTRASIDELGAHAPTTLAPPPPVPPQPTGKEREFVAVPSASSTQVLHSSSSYDNGIARSEENQSLMASITDALSLSHRGFTLEEATSLEHQSPDEPVPKYEPALRDVGRFDKSKSPGPVSNGHASSPPVTEQREGHRRATRRSTSPPCLPPGAAPAAVRGVDDRMGQGENGAHSDRPASSSVSVPSQQLTSSSELDGEEEEGLAYDRDSQYSRKEGGMYGNGKQRGSFSESGEGGIDAIYDERGRMPIQRMKSTGAGSNAGGGVSPGSQWRVARVPPPSMDDDMYQHEDDDLRTDESADERARNTAAAREVSRAMDALAFSAGGYATPRPPLPRYGSALSAQSQVSAPYPPSQSRASQGSAPPSPILPPNPPFANNNASPMIEMRPPPGHYHTSSDSLPGRLPTPTPMMSSAGQAPPPEYTRQQLLSSPAMARSGSSLNNANPDGAPRTISAAAFRRQQARSPSGTTTELGPADTSPLTLRRPSGSSLSGVTRSAQMGPVSRELPVPPPSRVGMDEEGSAQYHDAYDGERAGYAAGRYVSDLERH